MTTPPAAGSRARRDHLAGQEQPLVLAAVESLGAIYRSVNSYPHLAAAGLEGSPERLSDGELAQADWREVFGQRRNEGRASSDVAQVARAATFEAVQSLLVDMDRVIDGQSNETDGRIDEAGAPGAGSYGVFDEIARRVLLSGGEVLSVRKEGLPDGAPVAAIFRYAL
jgi:hypothetical protein